jgi:hypothetical protein
MTGTGPVPWRLVADDDKVTVVLSHLPGHLGRLRRAAREWDTLGVHRYALGTDTAAGHLVIETALPGWPGWGIVAAFVGHGGALTLAELRLIPMADAWEDLRPDQIDRPIGEWSRSAVDVPAAEPGVRPDMLRAVRTAPLLRVAAELGTALEGSPLRRASWWQHNLPPSPAVLRAARRVLHDPERPADVRLAGWAAEYAHLIAKGSRHVLKDLIALHPEEGSTDRIRDLIHEARQRGLLTKGKQGRAGGSLTPKAIELLSRRKGQKP